MFYHYISGHAAYSKFGAQALEVSVEGQVEKTEGGPGLPRHYPSVVGGQQ